MWNVINENMVRYRGLSTDEKPDVTIGSEFFEIDTGKTYLYSGSEWLEQPESGGGGSSVDVVELSVSSNNTYTAPSGKAYSPVVVNVPDTPAVVESLSVTENGTYTASAGTDGYSPVTVNVPPTVPVINSLSITQNGTYAAPTGVDGYSPITVSVSGGASNIVTGTFKGTTTGAAMDVTLNYSGSGYPIAAAIYPSGGEVGNSAYSTLVQRYAAAMFCVTKATVGLTPAYAKEKFVDEYVILHRYKSSTSSALTYSQASGQIYLTTGTNSTSTNTNIMNFKSKTSMSVFIASTSYGFAVDTEYTYQIIYSS